MTMPKEKKEDLQQYNEEDIDDILEYNEQQWYEMTSWQLEVGD